MRNALTKEAFARFLSDNPAYQLEEYFLLENDTPLQKRRKHKAAKRMQRRYRKARRRPGFSQGLQDLTLTTALNRYGYIPRSLPREQSNYW